MTTLRRWRSGRGGVLVGVVSVLVLASTAWVLWGDRGSGGAAISGAAEGTPVSVDRPAPAFTLPLLSEDGSLRSGADEGAVVVVNFWASGCRACRTEGPQLEDLWRDYRGRGVRFVGIDYRDGRSAAIDFVRSIGVTYPTVRDPKGSVADEFGIFGLPTTYIIGPDGRIRFVVIGKIHPTSFREALESVLAERSPGT